MTEIVLSEMEIDFSGKTALVTGAGKGKQLVTSGRHYYRLIVVPYNDNSYVMEYA